MFIRMMDKMCGIHKVAGALLIIGGLNWAAYGLFDFNLVDKVFGSIMWLEKLVYILIGASALMMLAAEKCCVSCSSKMKT
jgi:uncharacterized membrane protein YuzA (DUF378 family)